MNFRFFIFLISACMGLALAAVDYLYRQSFTVPAILFLLSTAFSFFVLQHLFERYVYKRIRNVYKLIHNLKLGKDLKDALGEHIAEDPIADAEQEVRDWAKQKAIEINALKEQAKFRKEFLSNISHEFKTPLFATQGYVETLQDGMIDEEPELAKKFLDKASRNLDRLSYLIQDLDEISKLESGTVPLVIERFDIHALIKECIEDLESKAAKNEIKLQFRGKSVHPLFVKGDKKKIQQVLVNLIDNSIKYGKKQGKSTISTFLLFDQILVEVTDDGLGIEEKSLSRVFERFYRTDKSRSRQIGGSGLGLSIVKHIIEAHQQNVNVRSTEGIGTTFGFTLDRANTH